MVREKEREIEIEIERKKKKNRIPPWIAQRLDGSGIDVVERAIAAAEDKTSGELVVAFARKSSAIGHVPLIIALLGGVAVLEVAWISEVSQTIAAGWLFLVAVMSFFVSSIPLVQRLCTSKRDRDIQVDNAAAAEFLRARVSHTQAATGVLIYISLMEHRVVVLGDSAIATKVQQSDWDGMVSVILAGIKRKDFAGGIKSGIEIAGELLAIHFPVSPGDRNELHNVLRFIN